MTSFHRIFSRVLDSSFSAPCRLKLQAWYQSTRPVRFYPTPSDGKTCRRRIAAQATTDLLRLIPSTVTELLAILTVAPN
jgi:hypothetical protein